MDQYYKPRFKIVLCTILLLLTLTSKSGSITWEYAVASATDTLEDYQNRYFQPLPKNTQLTQFLSDPDGWFWLRTDIEISHPWLLLNSPRLFWEAWWNETLTGQSGVEPPDWRPSQPLPEIYTLTDNSLNGTLLIKTWIRQGYQNQVKFSLANTKEELYQKQFFWSLERIGIPAVTVLMGLVLFIGSMLAFIKGWGTRECFLGLFGLFLTVFQIRELILLIPGLIPDISWDLITAISYASLPLALCAWRRSIVLSVGGEFKWISIIDLIITLLGAYWLIQRMGGWEGQVLFPLRISHLDPLPVLLAWSMTTALVVWGFKAAKDFRGHIDSLIHMLTALAITGIFWQNNRSITDISYIFFHFGLSASLLTILLTSLGRTLKGLPAEYQSEHKPSYKYRKLMTGIKQTIFPKKIPRNPDWDIASARGSPGKRFCGFFDIHQTSRDRMDIFSFLTFKKESLESLTYIYMVRSEINHPGSELLTLPQLAKKINTETLGTARAGRVHLKGAIGRLEHDSISLVPFSNPSLILLRSEGELLSLHDSNQKTVNSPLGSSKFGKKGVKLVKISMNDGDCLLLYSPTLFNLQSPEGKYFNLDNLAWILKTTSGHLAQEKVSEIIEGLKQFSNKDKLSIPLQLLLIKKR